MLSADDARRVDGRDVADRPHRQRVRVAERPQPVLVVVQVVVDVLGMDPRVHHQRAPVVHAAQRLRAHLVEARPEGVDPVRVHLQPGGHRVPAVAAEQRRAFRQVLEQVEARHAAAGAAPHAVVADADDHRRPVEAARDAAGHDPDDPRVPVRVGHHDAVVAGRVEQRVERLAGLADDAVLDFLALAARFVELLREDARARLALGEHQLQRGVGIAEAPRGVDARADDEADLVRVHRPRDARRLDERAQAHRVRPVEQDEPVVDEDAVLAEQRHDVRDRPDGDQFHETLEVHLRRRLDAAPPPLLEEPVAYLERDAHAREHPDVVRATAELGVDHRAGFRDAFGGRLVVVGDDDVDAEPRGLAHRLDGRRPAVHRDDEIRVVVLHAPVERIHAEPVPILQPVRQERRRDRAEPAEHLDHEGGGGDPVHVVVAVDEDGAPLLDVRPNHVHGLLHPGQHERVGHVGEPRLQEGVDGLVARQAARHERAGHGPREPVRFGDVGRDGGVGGRELPAFFGGNLHGATSRRLFAAGSWRGGRGDVVLRMKNLSSILHPTTKCRRPKRKMAWRRALGGRIAGASEGFGNQCGHRPLGRLLFRNGRAEARPSPWGGTLERFKK